MSLFKKPPKYNHIAGSRVLGNHPGYQLQLLAPLNYVPRSNQMRLVVSHSAVVGSSEQGNCIALPITFAQFEQRDASVVFHYQSPLNNAHPFVLKSFSWEISLEEFKRQEANCKSYSLGDTHTLTITFLKDPSKSEDPFEGFDACFEHMDRVFETAFGKPGKQMGSRRRPFDL